MRVLANGRVRRSEAEWRELVGRFRNSGESVGAFCQREKLVATSFHRWNRRIGEVSTQDFVPVSLSSGTSPAASTWSFEVVLPNGLTLRFQS